MGSPLPKNSMLVARQDGRLYQVDFTEFPHLNTPGAVDWDLSIAKMLIGKFQVSRTRFVTIDEITFENVVRTGEIPDGTTTDLEITVFKTLNGKSAEPGIFPVPSDEQDGLIVLPLRSTGQNFSVQLRGHYNVNTMTIRSHNHGRR